MANARIKKGDTVAIISGKDKGKTGTVLRVIPEELKVIVQGINMVTKHQKPTQRAPEGKRFQKEAALYWSKVMPVDPATGKPVRRVKTASIAETPKAEEKKPAKAKAKK
jgi:large subunit ribosomal protein L24